MTSPTILHDDRLVAYVADLKSELALVKAEADAANAIRFDPIATSKARTHALAQSRQLAARQEGLEYALAALDDHGLGSQDYWGLKIS